MGIFGQFDPTLDQKQFAQVAYVIFPLYGYQNFCFLPKELGFLAQIGQIWSKICIFGHFGPNIGFFGPFRPMPDQRAMQTRCLGGFSVKWVPKLAFARQN